MRRFFALAVALLAAATFNTGSLASGTLLSAHSHWDDPNGNYEVQACYEVIANVSGAGAEFAHLPFREHDSLNFYDLLLETNGIALAKRVGGGANIVITPTTKTTHTFGVGSQIMFDLVSVGTTISVYQLNADLSRGPLWYQWNDSTYTSGVNISYYTVNHWDGVWDFVHGKPLDSLGVGHNISSLTQDARTVTGSGTFDSTAPASGGVTGASLAKNGSSPNWGLPSGTNYVYTFTVDKAGTGHFDFRDPSSVSNGSGSYFASSYYRLALSTQPSIQRFNGSTAGTTYRAAAGTGVAGTYKLTLAGPSMVLAGPTGATLLTVNDGGPQWGVRVRLSPGSQVWSWTGTAGTPVGS